MDVYSTKNTTIFLSLFIYNGIMTFTSESCLIRLILNFRLDFKQDDKNIYFENIYLNIISVSKLISDTGATWCCRLNSSTFSRIRCIWTFIMIDGKTSFLYTRWPNPSDAKVPFTGYPLATPCHSCIKTTSPLLFVSLTLL